MEKLFVLLAALVVAVRNINHDLGVALGQVVADLKEWAEELVKDKEYYRGARNDAVEELKRADEKYYELEGERNRLSSQLAASNEVLSDSGWWALSFPISLMSQYKIKCVLAVRRAFPTVSLKLAKDTVEKLVKHGEPLFDGLLTTYQMVQAVHALTDGMGLNPADLQITRMSGSFDAKRAEENYQEGYW
jgi:hypothetical protein